MSRREVRVHGVPCDFGAVGRALVAGLALLVGLSGLGLAEDAAPDVGVPIVPPDVIEGVTRETRRKALAYKREKGLVYERGDTMLWFGGRIQPRYTTRPGTPKSISDLEADVSDDVLMRRARLKGGGHVLTPDLVFYTEYDLVNARTIDLRATLEVTDAFHLRIGQWKSDYNRERIDSSAKQQFVERSICTYWFTVDRQLGAVISGRVAEGRRLDSSYWFGVLAGTGRGGLRQTGDFLWMGRYQWNFTRRLLKFSQSDIDRRAKPAGSIALAGVIGNTEFTRFSGNGGSQLPGFDDGGAGRYRLRQLQLETAWQLRGFSWQQELHIKDIYDFEGGGEQTTLWGGYAQAGYFFCGLLPWVPRPLELAARVAFVDPNLGAESDLQLEFGFAANWFFEGHRNKLTADVSYLEFDDEASGRANDWRFRFQWEFAL